MGVFVIEMHHKPDAHLVVFQMIHEAATAGGNSKRPTHGMGYLARDVLGRIDFP